MVRVLNVYTISAFVAIGVALIGFDISSMSGVLGTHQYQDFYRNPLGIRQGLITSAMAAGSIAGALSAGALGNSRFSRKVTIQGGTVLWCIGSALQSASNGVPMLVCGRVISGICIGLTASLTPTYQSEIAPRKIRGRIVSFQSLAGSLGIMIQYFIQYGCSFIDSEASFRLPWAIQAVPAVVLFVGLFWFPYSPRWLASKDRWEEVLCVLAYLRTPNNDINNPHVLAEYKEIEDQIRFEREIRAQPIRELLSPKMRKRVFLGMAVQIWSQLTGMNVMMYYIVYILQSAGITSFMLASAIQYVINVVMTIPAILWVDKYGRRPALLLGALSMALWLYLIGGLLMQYGQPNPVMNQPSTWLIMDHPAVSRTILACSYLTVGSFAVTWAPVSWIYQAEVVPLRIRVRSVSLSTASNWAFNYLLALTVPPLLRSISWRLFFIFASLNVMAFVHMWFAAPETKQRTLEEIDEIFEHGEPFWKSFTGTKTPSRLEQLAKDIETGKLKIGPNAQSF
ncbi:general substrate transporter [Lipomyces starkeyi]